MCKNLLYVQLCRGKDLYKQSELSMSYMSWKGPVYEVKLLCLNRYSIIEEPLGCLFSIYDSWIRQDLLCAHNTTPPKMRTVYTFEKNRGQHEVTIEAIAIYTILLVAYMHPSTVTFFTHGTVWLSTHLPKRISEVGNQKELCFIFLLLSIIFQSISTDCLQNLKLLGGFL